MKRVDSKVTWIRLGLPTPGEGTITKTIRGQGGYRMHEVRDARGNVFWFRDELLQEVPET
jgi:hypothetical protein